MRVCWCGEVGMLRTLAAEYPNGNKLLWKQNATSEELRYGFTHVTSVMLSHTVFRSLVHGEILLALGDEAVQRQVFRAASIRYCLQPGPF